MGPDALAALERLDILSRKIFAGKLPGERRSKKRGQSVEFDDYRSYVPGDDLRHVDWNVFARMDRFFIKLFREEEDLALHLVLDASGSMDAGSPSKLIFAARLALSLGYLGLAHNNRVRLACFGFGPGLSELTPIRGRRQIQRLGAFLIDQIQASARLEPGSPTIGFNDALKRVALSRSGRGVMVVLSDFLVPEGYRDGLTWLAAGTGFDTWCLQILSPGELDPALETDADGSGVTGDLKLLDVETGRAAEVTITAKLLAAYRTRVADYCDSLHAFCASRGMTHALISSDRDAGRLILRDLRHAALVG